MAESIQNQIPTSITGTSNLGCNSSTQTDEAAAEIAKDVSKESTSISPDVASSSSLWCPVTLRSHASLVEWSILRCNSCNQTLSPPRENEVKPPEDNTKDNTTETEKKASEIVYKVKFLNEYNDVLSVQNWHEQLDLERERKAMPTTPGSAKPIVEVISVVTTDLASDDDDFSWNDREQVIRNVIKNATVVADYGGREIVLNSRPVFVSLRRIITYYPGLQLVGQSLKLEQPYCVYYHHMEDIEAYLRTWAGASGHGTRPRHPMEQRPGFTPCDEETHHHLSMLSDVMKNQETHALVTEELTRYKSSPPVATYQMLWLLLKPGTTVYSNIRGKMSAYVVSSVTFDATVEKPPEKYRVNLWYLDFDGVKVGRCPCHLNVVPFDGEREINHLDIIPSSYYDKEDGGELRRSLEARGKRYLRLLSGAQVDYDGESLGNQRRLVQGRVIIDPSTYHTYAPSSKYDDDYRSDLRPPVVGKINDAIVTTRTAGSRRYRRELAYLNSSDSSDSEAEHLRNRYGARYSRFKSVQVGPWAAYDSIIPKEAKLEDPPNEEETEEIRAHRFLLCPREVIGFELISRRWELLDVELCVDVRFNKAAIDNLVMPEDRILMIKSLVHRFTDADAINGKVPKAWTADFIKHKGEGQIFLLHGSPGIGKTYTAECISEATGRPLLSLTAGDIGTDEARAERTLAKWFRMAEIWGAVMLLDEADVFLEKRVHQDLQRNSLVSIFLRTIEYYRGILFLTTNRVGHFDDAFISRIHVVIPYTNFTPDDRNRIWNQFFQKLQDEREENIKITESAREYVFESKKMKTIHWNGREIRNAFQTAVAFADYRFFMSQKKGGRATLERQDFEKVVATTEAFKKYLDSIPEADEAKRAREGYDRNDSFQG